MIKIKPFNESHFEINNLAMILQEMNEFFQPPLLERIMKRSTAKNFEEYVSKVSKDGNVIVACDSNVIKGVIMFYTNDLKNLVGYISILAVSPKFQGMGISNKLVNFAIRESKIKKMHSLNVNTWTNNYAAIKLYEKHGFVQKKIEGENVLLTLKM